MKRNPRFQDLTGQKFGLLTVLRFAESRNQKSYWQCQCECGAEKAIWSASLKNGETRSCGCYQVSSSRARFTKHGKNRTKAYGAWSNMISRCQKPHTKYYRYYGARGISVCEAWQDFERFYADMGEPPAGLSLDRIDNDGNYCPENCRWATKKQQMRNTRRTRVLTWNNKSQCIQDWAKETGLLYETIWYRLDRGWPVGRALTP